MGTYALFQAYETRITATPSELESSLGRARNCISALTSHYYGGSQSVTDTTSLIGSAVKNSGISPIGDIDVVFPMPVGTQARYDGYSYNGQSALLQDVRSVLGNRYPGTTIKGDGPVVVVDFSTGAAVEVVPIVLHTRRDIVRITGSVPVTRSSGQWESVDYGAQFDRFASLDQARSQQLSRLMKYMKAWRRAHFAVLKTIVIELMAIEFFKSWDTSCSRTDHIWDDWLVRDFLAYMVRNQDTTYYLAGSGMKPFQSGYGWRTDASKAAENATEACQHDADSSLYRYYWREVFGSAFGQ
jgi:hypothetical protein